MVVREEARRVHVNFTPSAYKTLEELAESKGKTVSETLRDAIALEKYFEDTKREGGKILVERPNGEIRELIKV